jgi:hypothetical protein
MLTKLATGHYCNMAFALDHTPSNSFYLSLQTALLKLRIVCSYAFALVQQALLVPSPTAQAELTY